jgi:hypothetical protein
MAAPGGKRAVHTVGCKAFRSKGRGRAPAPLSQSGHVVIVPRLHSPQMLPPPNPALQFADHARRVKALDVATVGSCPSMDALRALAAAEAACSARAGAAACASDSGCSWVPSRRACQPSHAETSRLLGMDGQLLAVAALCQAQASRGACLGAGNITVAAADTAVAAASVEEAEAAAWGEEQGWAGEETGFPVVPIARAPEA